MMACAAQNYDSKLLHHEIPEGPFSYNSDHFISTGGQCRVGLDAAFETRPSGDYIKFWRLFAVTRSGKTAQRICLWTDPDEFYRTGSQWCEPCSLQVKTIPMRSQHAHLGTAVGLENMCEYERNQSRSKVARGFFYVLVSFPWSQMAGIICRLRQAVP